MSSSQKPNHLTFCKDSAPSVSRIRALQSELDMLFPLACPSDKSLQDAHTRTHLAHYKSLQHELSTLLTSFEQSIPYLQIIENLNIALHEIATSPDQITSHTKVYDATNQPNFIKQGVLKKLSDTNANIERIYRSYNPNNTLEENESQNIVIKLEIGGYSKDELIQKIKDRGMKIWEGAEFMMNSTSFTTSTSKQTLTLYNLNVSDLFVHNPTTLELLNNQNLHELGVTLCPAEVGPNYRYSYTNQPLNEWKLIGMERIKNSSGNPSVFNVARNSGDAWLNYDWVNGDSRWDGGSQFVLCKFDP